MSRRRFSETDYRERLSDFKDRCSECGIHVGGAAGLEWDHIIPLAMHGDDDLSNMQPLCRGCHKAKTKVDKRHIAKGKKQERRELGIKNQSRNPLPGGRDSGWIKTFRYGWVKR